MYSLFLDHIMDGRLAIGMVSLVQGVFKGVRNNGLCLLRHVLNCEAQVRGLDYLKRQRLQNQAAVLLLVIHFDAAVNRMWVALYVNDFTA